VFGTALVVVFGFYWLLRALGLQGWINVMLNVLLFVTFVGMLVWRPSQDSKPESK
jgi:hypothetical protein